MLSVIAIVPSAPVLIPELAGSAAAELADLRAAVFAAAALLPARWVSVGVGPTDEFVGPDRVGTFAGYGVDVAVRLSPDAKGAPTAMPLCALVTGWLRGQTAPSAHAEVRICARQLDRATAVDRGRALRAEIDQAAEPVGVLVVADGANTLIPSAPGGYDPDSVPVQQVLDDALVAGDSAALARLPGSILGRAAYALLAGLAEPAPPVAQQFYRGAPYGVGYFTGTWQP